MEAAIEGFWGARYRFTRYHAGDPDPLESLTIVVGSGEVGAAERGVDRGRVIADATRLARDLSNEPAGALTPTQLAEVAVEVAERAGLQSTILDEDAIVADRLGGLLGVAAGSVQPPRLIKLVYEPTDADAQRRADGSIPTVALVGKGITFDSGGLSLKSADGHDDDEDGHERRCRSHRDSRCLPCPRDRCPGDRFRAHHREHARWTGDQAR